MFLEFPAMARITSHGWFQSLIRTVDCTDQRLKSIRVGYISDPGTKIVSLQFNIYIKLYISGLAAGDVNSSPAASHSWQSATVLPNRG